MVINYEWCVGEAFVAGETLTLTGLGLEPGDEVICTVTVEDASGATVSDGVVVVIENRFPVVGEVTIEGARYYDSTLRYLGSGSDLDGAVTLSYAWNAGGVSYDGEQMDLST